MIDLFLAALLGFAIGVLWQEFNYRKVTAALDEAVERMDRIEGRRK